MLKKLDVPKLFAIFIVTIILVSAGIVVYSSNALKKAQLDYNTKILALNKELLESLNKLRQDTERELFVVQSNLSLKLNLVENNLNSFRKQNEQELTTLNNLIEQIEQQSNIQLQELKDELGSIEVQGGDFSAIVDEVLQSVVSVGTDKGQGSGAIIEDNGFIVTNYHVVNGANIIRVLTSDGRVHDAQFIGYNDVIDIAVLKMEGDFKKLRYGDSDDTKVGEKVIALGNPAGLSFTVTEGIVSAVHRKGPNNLAVYIQTDVPVNPGNSGGPLVNTNSRLIGINNFKIAGFEGLGFAIESNTVKQIADDIIEQYLAAQQQ
ncbi:trypsin-like peptidase domain-containing protein [Candidatus Woesearchaeota archaeon]|nr:trypsin-like peptidase domain-containing protein [Candidatus Woesearchaeota archaeon]